MLFRPLKSSFMLFSYILFYKNFVPTFGFTNQTDMQALLAIKDGIQEDPFRVFSSWNNSLHFCKWQGVSCSQRHQRVSALNLSSLKLVGSLSPHIGNLTFLRLINLDNNSFHGVIPQEVGLLFRIQYLYLGYNLFEGEFPVNVTHCSDLRIIHLIQNNLTGNVPTQLASLLKLYSLVLTTNSFYGTIPPALGNLSALRFLYMSYNNLQGQIPIELGKLLNLQDLQLSVNNLTGMIPPTLYNISTIQFLSLAFNQLHGSLPSNLGLFLPKLEFIYVGGNQFSGSIPSSLVNASGLVEIDFSENAFTGAIPQNLGDLQQLERLIFGDNPLGAKKTNDLHFLTSLTNCTNLRTLILNHNQLGGVLPSLIANLSTELIIIDLQENYLSGSIPLAIGNPVNLKVISFSENQLTGSIPNSMGKLIMMEGLYLNINKISGKIPTSSGNQLSGNIPSTLGDCLVLEFLNMEGNHFEGTIPSSFKQLKGIQLLDLSHNNLSGKIPSFLGEFSFIQYLNLSYNMFEGEVPSEGRVFRNISAFSIAGNSKLCGGNKALELLACPTKISKKQGKHFSRVVIIAISVPVCITLLLTSICAILYWNRRKKEKTTSTLSLGNQYPNLSYAELLQATEGFSARNLIECKALSNIRHRNLVKIITACSSIDFKGNEFKALVFEFITNGSLESWLHSSSSNQEDSRNLNLLQRLNIAVDVASTLDYLHNHCETPIIHCDLKPSNVLLDDDLSAHVGDFGLARICLTETSASTHTRNNASSGIRGTIGYIAPEYAMGGEVSIKGDVYSFGILLLEMFTGKRPTDNMFTDNFNLHKHVKRVATDLVMEIVDPLMRLEGQNESNRASGSRGNVTRAAKCLGSILQIGVMCSADLPSERININDALMELQMIRDVYLGKREMK